MKRKIVTVLIAVFCVFAFSFHAFADSVPTQKNYSYSNSLEEIPAPQAYGLTATIFDNNMPFSEVTDVQVLKDKAYVLDSLGGKIFVINREYKIEKIICGDLGLNQPQGFFISDKGYIYIADTSNGRVVKTDLNGNPIAVVEKPSNYETISTVKFEPKSIVVDGGERLYIIVSDETNGIYQMNMDGEFLGFFGSVPVVPSLTELFWRSISTKEQLSRMLLFVPTEYSSMDIDNNGFIYTTTATNSADEMKSFISGGGSSNLAPIRKLNPKNVDVLLRNGSMPPAGDTVEDTPSRFIDIAVRDDGIYCALDSTYSRVFAYSQYGELLFIFGNENTKKDGLKSPGSLCWWDDDIIITDKGNGLVKVYSPTQFANTIFRAIQSESKGDYKTSNEEYRRLLEIHPGNALAYHGVLRT